MFLSVEILDLVLYCLQQIGVMIAVGAETIILISYIVTMRDGRVEEAEARFAKAVRKALGVGLGLIALSGLAIVAVHASLGQLEVVFSPAFVFKWLLILLLACFYFAQQGKPYRHFFFEGFAGATWYALFLVHILAPITSWGILFGLYAGLAAVFVAVWTGVVYAMRPQTTSMISMQPKVMVLPVPPPMPTQAPKPIVKAVVPPPPLPPKPTPKPVVIQKPAIEVSVIPPQPKQTPIPPPPPKPIAPVVPPPAPVVATPVPKSAPIVAVPIVQTPPPQPPQPKPQPAAPVGPPEHHSPWLPAIHVMPRAPQEAEEKAHILPLALFKKNA